MHEFKTTKMQRELIVGALKACKRYLSKDTSYQMYNPNETYRKTEFICIALQRSGHKGYTLARDIIDLRLHGNPTFTDWLIDYDPMYKQMIKNDCARNSGCKLQKTRRAWVDSLIKEFS